MNVLTGRGGWGAGNWTVAVAVISALLLAGCAKGSGGSRDSDSLPSYATAARLRPCDRISATELSRITRVPAHVDRVPKGLGGIGQRPQLSTGAALPKVWSATCTWTNGLYLQVELASDAADARTEFHAVITGMHINSPPSSGPGKGQKWVSDIASRDDAGTVVVLALQGPEVVNVQLPWNPDLRGSAARQLARAATISKLIVAALSKTRIQ